MSRARKAQIEPPKYPAVLDVNGRLYNWRSQIEHYKEQLARHALGLAPLPLPTTRPEGDVLVPVKISASELGVGRRTLGRRIKEAADQQQAPRP